MAKNHADKVPELLAAAARAPDADTALLLLRKAKSLDPRRIETYQRIASLLAEHGDQAGVLEELRSILDVDPLHWGTRLALLALEHPLVRSLERAGALLRDLAWERRYPERWLNAGRGRLRSESELGHDQSLLGHLGLSRDEGYGVVLFTAVAALPDGGFAVLNQSEPWLEVFEADGALRFGTDLWVTDERAPTVDPSDVAATDEGVVLVADRRRGVVRRYASSTGEPLGAFAPKGRGAPVAIDAAPGGALWVLGDDGALQGYDTHGRAVGRRRRVADLAAGHGRPLGGDPADWGLAVDARGEAHVHDGRVVCSLGRRGRPARMRKVPGGAGRARRGERHGIAAAAPEAGGFWLAQPGKSALLRLGDDGEVLERVRAIPPHDGLARPRDVALLASGALVVCDTGHARILERPADGSAGRLVLGHPAWRPA